MTEVMEEAVESYVEPGASIAVSADEFVQSTSALRWKLPA